MARTAQQPTTARPAPTRFTEVAALTRPRNGRAIAHYRASISDADRAQFSRATAGIIPTTIVVVIVLVGAIGTPLAATLFFAIAYTLYPDPVGWVLVAILAVVTALLWFTLGRWMVRILRREWAWRGSWEHRWRLNAFAHDNSLIYLPRGSNLQRIGSVLTGIRAKYWDVFAATIDQRTVVFGNARSNMTASQSHAREGWSFCVVKLPTHVPHMYLRPNTRLGRLSPLIAFGGGQRMSLEGEFDRHFTLYAPKEYERDALYVITPDLMALLIDELPGSHVETFADNLVITTPKPLHFERLDSWERMSRLLDTVVPKAVRQTYRYQDHRSEIGGEVAEKGRRMRYSIPVVSVISFVFLVISLIRLWNQLHGIH